MLEKDIEIAELKNRYYELTEKDKLLKLREQYEEKYQNSLEQPLIFVYTPTYNRGEILKERALRSVLEQTYKNFIYLIVGDCCNDETENIVKSIEDPRVRFFNIKERNWRYPPTAENHWLAGPVVAANMALSMVEGDWIARIDDDDIWEKDHLESMIKFAIEGNWEFVSSNLLMIRDGKESINKGDNLYSEYFRIPFPNNNKEIYNPLIGGTNTWVYRSYLKEFKYNEDCWRKSYNRVNDIDLCVRMGLAGVRMGHLDKVTCSIIPRPGEDTIGLDAYKRNKEKHEKHFEF